MQRHTHLGDVEMSASDPNLPFALGRKPCARMTRRAGPRAGASEAEGSRLPQA